MWQGSAGTGPGTRTRDLATYEILAHDGAYRWKDRAPLREMVLGGLRAGCATCVRRNGKVLWTVNYAAECESPAVVRFRARGVRSRGGESSDYLVTLVGRCRHCEWCRWRRSMHWAHRATTEYERSPRTWLGTVTLAPVHHAMVDAKVALRAKRLGHDLREYSAKDTFRARCQVVGTLCTLWLKRIREAEGRRRLDGSRPQFSYMLVAEEHRSVRTSTTLVGRPHFHILIHEASPFELIRSDEYYVTQKGVTRVDDKAMIRTSWEFGFTQFELCRDPRSASYLCKYLSKDMQWRVRASVKYGEVVDNTASGASGSGAPELRSETCGHPSGKSLARPA